MQNELLNSDFVLQYKAFRAQRLPIDQQIEALKQNHASTFPVQPGSKATLKYRDGDTETVAIVALRVNTGTGDISPIFRRVTSNGVSEKTYPGQHRTRGIPRIYARRRNDCGVLGRIDPGKRQPWQRGLRRRTGHPYQCAAMSRFKPVKLQQYLLRDGKLFQVVGISDGQRVVFLKGCEHESCPHCGGMLPPTHEAHVESSPNFQDQSEPITTIQPI
jgi:hypothetical protein